MFNFFYNLVLSDVSRLCYGNCLSYFAHGAHVLDVGIGNGVMLEWNHELIEQKNLFLTGLDINQHYIAHCRERIARYGLQDRIEVFQLPVEQYSPSSGNAFDYVLFSMSFMLLPDQEGALEKVKQCIKPEGEIVFTQTMFQQKSKLLDSIKPRLKYITSVDFGEPVYEHDFFGKLQQNGLQVYNDHLLKINWLGAQYRMITAKNRN